MSINFQMISLSNMANNNGARAFPDLKIFSGPFGIIKIFFMVSIFILSNMLLSLSIAEAASVTLTWERNQEPDIAGYKIFYGKRSHSYTDTITINDTANKPLYRNYTITGLQEGTTYYFAIKAFDLAGQESDFSDEVSVEIPAENGGGTGDDGGSLTGDWYNSENWIEVGATLITHKWKTVRLRKTFQNPVVIVGPPSYHGTQPCVIRLRHVKSNSFEIRIQEWMYLDGYHMSENVSYMVVEAGVHFLPDGTMWEAGKFNLSGTLKWQKVTFPSPFSAQPLVFQTIQTFNGYQAVTMRQKGVTADHFYAAMEEEERLNDGHAVETVGYLAIEKKSVTGAWSGSANCNHKFVSISSVGKQLRAEEETSRDRETYHAYEQVGILDVGGKIFAQIQTFKGSDTVDLRIR